MNRIFIFYILGGTITMEDLTSFKVWEEDAWTVPLGDIKMHIPPPPAGGALLAFILKLMKGVMYCVMTLPQALQQINYVLAYSSCSLNYEEPKTLFHNISFNTGCCSFFPSGLPLTPKSLNVDQKIQMYHHYIEAAKFANGQRSSIRDPRVYNEKVGI